MEQVPGSPGSKDLVALTGLSLSLAPKRCKSDPPIAESRFVTRKGFGQEGELLPVFANHFPLELAHRMVYHYDLDIELTRVATPSDNPGSFIGHREPYEGAGVSTKKLRRMTYKVNRGVVESTKKLRKMTYKVNRGVVEKLIGENSDVGQLFNGVTPVYDGFKNMYTKTPLPEITSEFQGRFFVDLEEETGEGRVYAINIKYAGQVDLDAINLYYSKQMASIPLESIQVLDIILRHGPNSLRIPIGRSLYLDSELSPRTPIGYGREVAFGHYQSVRGTMSGPNLVVDRSATVFYAEGPLVSFVAQLLPGHSCNGRPNDEKGILSVPQLSDYDRRRIERELKHLQVRVNHLHDERRFRITGVTYLPAREVTFRYQKNGDFQGRVSFRHQKNGDSQGLVSVPEYFKQEYGLDLKYPNLPCITVGNGPAKNFLPIEVCDLVPNQIIRRKLNSDQLAQMVRVVASQNPSQRFGVIKESVESVIQDSGSFCQEFGIKIQSKPMVVDARLLDAPQLRYGGKESLVSPVNGVWHLDKRQNFFSVPSNLGDRWILVNFAPNCSDEDAGRFVDALTSKAQEMGLDLRRATKVARVHGYSQGGHSQGGHSQGGHSQGGYNQGGYSQGGYSQGMIGRVFDKANASCTDLKMIMFIVTGEESLYNEIKLTGDIKEGIPTQCVAEKNVKRLTGSFLSNLVLKINTKLGGTNGVIASNQDRPEMLSKSREGAMIVGADVTHPSTPSTDRLVFSSVAALVGSFDSDCTKYFASVRVQEKDKQEVIRELDEMALEILNKYQEENDSQLPGHIIIYRDGVSEGQFEHVLREELASFHSACDKTRPGYSPKITFLVVQKRHHTRFIPCQESRKFKNIPPGTVVDTDCVHPTDFDFYLCSHFCVQGTSRPTHYHVLWDDNNFGPDHLQKLTFYLCHIYAKCNRSISIPAPVQYAHLAAYRARVHILGVYGSESTSASYEEGRRGGNRIIQDYNQTIRVSPKLKQSMYFC